MSPVNLLPNQKRILLLGMSPMPFENDRKVYGTGIRTWQFLVPLLEKKYKICVCNYAIPSAYGLDFKTSNIGNFKVNIPNSTSATEGFVSNLSFEYNIFSPKDFENIESLIEIYLRFKPDCVVGCSFYPSYIASRLINNLKQLNLDKKEEVIFIVPFWADLFGHVMAEAQARAYIDGNDECLFHYWNCEYNIISTADVFSSVSERQRYALIGELGAIGRLNHYTSGYEFVYCIPCGMPSYPFKHEKIVLRDFMDFADKGKDRGFIDSQDFIVLWTGGYNTWTDVNVLFKGLVKAMEKNSKIKFVSTGGEIPEQDLKTYPKFLKMIENSRFKNNFIMKGWIKGEDVPNYYFEADVGINIDKDIYEVRLGSKNRILDWFRAGLGVLSSNVCELTEIIEKEKIGYTFKAGDADDLAQKILYLAENKSELKQTAVKGQKYAYDNFNFKKTTADLQRWIENLYFAPDYDKEKVLNFQKDEALKNLQIITDKQKKMIEQKDNRIKELEAITKKTFIYKIYGYFKILKRKIGKKKYDNT